MVVTMDLQLKLQWLSLLAKEAEQRPQTIEISWNVT